jgi:hypothetical protein
LLFNLSCILLYISMRTHIEEHGLIAKLSLFYHVTIIILRIPNEAENSRIENKPIT